MTLCMNRTVAWWETTPYHTTKWQGQSHLLQTGMATKIRDERALKCEQATGSWGMLNVVLQAIVWLLDIDKAVKKRGTVEASQ